VQQFDLARVDQRFTVKAEILRQIRFREEPSSLLISDHTTSYAAIPATRACSTAQRA
jgi:hypothetical protein